MSEFDELVASPGVLMAGRFGPDGHVAEHKSKSLYVAIPASAAMAQDRAALTPQCVQLLRRDDSPLQDRAVRRLGNTLTAQLVPVVQPADCCPQPLKRRNDPKPEYPQMGEDTPGAPGQDQTQAARGPPKPPTILAEGASNDVSSNHTS